MFILSPSIQLINVSSLAVYSCRNIILLFSHNGMTKKERSSSLRKSLFYLRLRILFSFLWKTQTRNVPRASKTKETCTLKRSKHRKIKFCVFLIVAHKRPSLPPSFIQCITCTSISLLKHSHNLITSERSSPRLKRRSFHVARWTLESTRLAPSLCLQFPLQSRVLPSNLAMNFPRWISLANARDLPSANKKQTIQRGHSVPENWNIVSIPLAPGNSTPLSCRSLSRGKKPRVKRSGRGRLPRDSRSDGTTLGRVECSSLRVDCAAFANTCRRSEK